MTEHICCISTVFAAALLMAEPVFANQSPTLAPLDDVTIAVGEQVSVRVVPSDPEGVVPSLRLSNMPAGAMFSDNGDGTRTFKWLPIQRDKGSLQLHFEVIDAVDPTLRNTQSMTITVVDGDDPGPDRNQPPRIEPLIDREVTVGDSFDFRVVPYDPEGSVPALRVNNLPQNASFDDNRDGTRQFRWTPAEQQLGEHTVSFVAYDENTPSLRATETITLSVNQDSDDKYNGLMFAGLEDQFVYLGQSLDIVVRAESENGSVPGLAVERLPFGASFEDNGDGTRSLRWFPYPESLGDNYINVIAIDAIDANNRIDKTIKITVERDPNNPVNFPPIINGIRNPIIRAGDTLNQLVQPVDPDFTVPNLLFLNQPEDAQFIDNGNGTRTFVWPTQFEHIGEHSFSFVAKDSEDPSLQFEKTITVKVVDPATLERSGERLRALADRRDFLIGFASVLNAAKLADNELYQQIAAEEFNIITAENSHKMGWIQPRRGEFKWESADELADYADANDMVLHGHPLVWYAQLPDWVQALNPAQAQEVMIEHINALAGRYKGRVKIWDVVNEAINDNNGKLRESIWFKGMGEGYIRKAFETARAADPDAVLLYNDYDVAWFNTKSDAMYELLKRELAAGTPIDGVGFQMHLHSDFTDFAGMQKNLQRFADLGLDIYITELDVAMAVPDEQAVQATVFQRSLEICLAQPKCKSMQSWGFTDRYSWRSRYRPLLFTSEYKAKPAYFAWQSTLRDYLR